MLYFKNPTIITADINNNISVFNSDIITEKDKIVYIGNEGDKYLVKTGQPYETVDLTDKILMPGLINGHSHVPMTVLRNYGDDLPLHDWLHTKIFPAEAQLTPDDIYWSALLGCAEMLLSGVTCFADMYFELPHIAKAVLESGIKANLSRGISGDLSGSKENIKETVELYKYYDKGDGKIKIDIGCHSVYTCTPELLSYVAKTAYDLNAGIHIHISETIKENDDCLKEYGKTPVVHLLNCGFFKTRTIAAHTVHLSDNDLKILSGSNVHAVHNPTSNLKLGSGIMDYLKMKQSKINICLGTDGASSNNNLNMIEEMHLCSILHKGITYDTSVIDSSQVIKMATVKGAAALGRENECGRILEGYKADFTIFDCSEPHMIPMGDPVNAVTYSAQMSDVDMVVCDGEIVVKNHKPVKLDMERIVYEVKRIRNKFL